MTIAPKAACLVTGCAGFIGSHLTDALLASGHPVVGVDIRPRAEAVNLAGAFADPRFHYMERDINEHGVLAAARQVCPDIRHVFHLAAVVMVAFSMDHPELTMATNSTATRALHEESVAAGAQAFIFAGSAAEYGDDPRLPLKEEYATDDTEQASPYGKAKYLSSRLMQTSGFGCSLRFFNIFGPRQDPSSPYSGVISKFITQAVAGKDLTIFGDGGQTRDFIYVSDVIRSYLIAGGILPNPRTGTAEPLAGIFNVGTGSIMSINELAQQAIRSAGASSAILHAPARAGDIYHSQADIDLFTRTTGFTPDVDFLSGLNQTVDWFRSTR